MGLQLWPVSGESRGLRPKLNTYCLSGSGEEDPKSGPNTPKANPERPKTANPDP